MLHKKGPRDDMVNYRTICFLCHSHKLPSAIVARWLMVVLEEPRLDSGRLDDAGTTCLPSDG